MSDEDLPGATPRPTGGTIRITSSARPAHRRVAPPPTALRELEEDDSDEKPQARLGVRLTVTAVIVLALFTVMVGRLWSLQVLQTQTFKAAENNTTTKTVQLTPIRGLIFARDGKLLVSNEVLPVVTLDRTTATDDPAVIPRLAALLGMTVAQVRHQITDDQYSPYEPIPIQVGVQTADILYIAEHRSELPGVAVAYDAIRYYPYGYDQPAPELLGNVGDITAAEYKKLESHGYLLSDVVGQYGVEETFQSWLRGKPGTQTVVVDPQGDVLGVRKTNPAQPGDALVLSLDLGLQNELDKALAAQIHTLRQGAPASATGSTVAPVPADWGAAVVLDPQNGQVLAMSSYPSNQIYGYSGLTPPGSTFKLATATAALDSGLITSGTYINDPGSFSFPNCSGQGCTLLNAPGDGALGELDVSTALAKSDDVFFYTLGDDFFNDPSQYGKTPIQEMAARYGFGQLTGIDVGGADGQPAELAGQVDNPSLPIYQQAGQCYCAGEAVQMAFGQGATEITALQLADAYATIANGGKRFVPQVAAQIVDAAGQVVKSFPPVVAATVPLPDSTRAPILAGLEGVITNGTAQATFRGFNLSAMPLAGKTGTADTFHQEPNGLFVAFGPCSGDCPPTQPQYVVAVVIDQAGYGAGTAAPVVRQVFQYLIAHPVQPAVVPARPAG
jgi:penicillin-binding protein 2